MTLYHKYLSKNSKTAINFTSLPTIFFNISKKIAIFYNFNWLKVK